MLSRRLLFIIFSFWTTAGLHALSVGLGGAGTVALGAGQGFGPKLQYGAGGSVEIIVPLLSWLDLGLGIVVSDSLPSDASGGFTYAGFLGADMRLSVQAHGTLGKWERIGELRAGGGIGAAAALAGYEYTTLYFFYPAVTAEAFLDYIPSFLPSIAIRVSLPFTALFRRDMDYSLQAGIGLGASYRFGGGA